MYVKSAQVPEAELSSPRVFLELLKAHELQERMQPRAMLHGRAHVSVAHQSEDWVSGDYFDLVPLSDNRLLICLGDVSGKGISAGLVTAALHGTVRTQLYRDQRLRTLVNTLNRYLCGTFPTGVFVTMTAAVIDTACGRVEFVYAGHPPMIVHRASGAREILWADGNLPLGIDEFEPIEYTTQLNTGDIMLLYSDGWTDAGSPSGGSLGVAGVSQLVARVEGGIERLDQLAAQSLSDLSLGERETLCHDDRTLLLVRMLQSGIEGQQLDSALAGKRTIDALPFRDADTHWRSNYAG